MKTWVPISLILIALSARSFGQAAPTATEVVTSNPSGVTGPRLSWVDGTVHYAVTASEFVQLGYFGPNNTTSTTAFSGNVGWATESNTHPTSLLVSGGVLIGQGGQGTSTFESFGLTQGLVKGKWIFNFSDFFSFIPQSPTAGISGVPGVGDLGITQVPGPATDPAGGVLTYSGNRISNMMSGGLERRLNGKTSLSGSASWSLLHFLDKNAGLDNSSISGSVSLNRRINARNSAGLSAVYSTYEVTGIYANLPTGFPQDNITYTTKGVNLSYQHQWTRLLSTDVSGGPQFIQSSAAQLIPDKLNFFASAGVNYSRQIANFSAHYSHGVNGGSGVQAGAISDNATFSANRTFGRAWAASGVFSYSHTSGLFTPFPNSSSAINGATSTEWFSLQANRALTRTISFYGSYTIQNQSINKVLSTQNAFSGLSNTFGFGVTWAPQSKRVGEF
jgi:hypothetical protein